MNKLTLSCLIFRKHLIKDPTRDTTLQSSVLWHQRADSSVADDDKGSSKLQKPASNRGREIITHCTCPVRSSSGQCTWAARVPPLYKQPPRIRTVIHSSSIYRWLCIFLWVLTFPLEDCSEFGNFVITLIYTERSKMKLTQNYFRKTWATYLDGNLTAWEMEFHPSKCQLLRVPNKRKPYPTNYDIHGYKLEI
jgi:hypothetical protein